MKKRFPLLCYGWVIVALLCTTTFGGGQLKNPHFKKGFSNWPLHIHPSLKSVTTRAVKDGVLTIQISSPNKPQHVQLMQTISLKEGQLYKLAFDAKREGPKVPTRLLCVQKSKSGQNNGLDQTITVLDKWSRHELVFTARRIDSQIPSVLRIFLGNQSSIQLRQFFLTETEKKLIKKHATISSMRHNTPSFRIIPQPRDMTLGHGKFQLGDTLFVQSNRSFSTGLLEREVAFITGRTKGQFQIRVAQSEHPFLSISHTENVNLQGKVDVAPPYPGGYTLAIFPQGIAVKGYDDEGLNNGIQSFLQVLEQFPNGTLPQLSVVDMPIMEFRAMHLILRPPFHWKKKTVAEVLDIYRWIFRRLGRYKYNNVCLMIKGDLKLKRHPEVWPNAAFTHEEVRQFLDIAAEHNLTVFPELKSLAKFFFRQPQETLEAHADMIHRQNDMHMGKWKFHVNSHWTTERLTAEQQNPKANGKLGMSLNVRNPKVLPLVKDCIDEFYELFDQPKLFHIGVDEAYYFGESWPKEVNRGVEMANYLNTLNRYIKKKGARTVMWGDMLLSHASMPYFFEHNGGPPLNTAKALPLLDDDIIISDWHYGYTVAGVTPEHYPSIPWFRKHGHDVIPVPWFNTKNMIDMARDSIATESKGIMGSSWSFHMAYRLYAYPESFLGKADLRRQITRNRELGILSSIAEVAWRPFHAKDVMKQYDSVQWELRWFPERAKP